MSEYIQSKVYYDKTTGEIYGITDEYYDSTGQINIPSLEDDLNTYQFLNNVDKATLEFIELEYGEYTKLLSTSKSYSINLETKKLDVVYYTQEELEERRKQHERPPIDYAVLIPEILKSLIQ